MVVALVATKLNLPVLRSRTVARPRLLDLLQRGRSAKLTLISAPAGFGKTTLLADWLAHAPPANPAIAWLSIDDSDNEPARFWSHVAAALRAGYARAGARLPDLPEPVEPEQGFVALLINTLAASDVPIVLVLDDLHLVNSPGIHQQLAYLIERLPAHVSVVISTRADPDLPLARLRVRGDLVEIRSDNLRFAPPEAVAYLNEVMGLGLSPGDAARLESKTEGWIAALQLAVLSLQGRDDATTFIDDFAGSGRYIVDYLVEEVLTRLPDDLRDFLVRTSALRRMSGSLCDFISGDVGNGQMMLERLERQNLFVVPLDDRREWFRYHHLFADVVRAHTTPAEADAVSGVHRRASVWFEDHGERAEAIHHALEAADYEWAAELIERAIPQMRRYRQEALFRTWIKPLPVAIVRSRPVLNVAYVGVLVSLGTVDGLAARLSEAEAEIARLPEPGPTLAHVELYRTALAQGRGDADAAASHAQRVLDLAAGDDHLARAGASGFLGIVSWTRGELEDAARFWGACRDGLAAQGHFADVQGATIALTDIRGTQGRLSEAMRLGEAALAVATDCGRPLARGVADTYVSLAFLELERNDMAQAAAHLDQGRVLGEVWGLPQFPYRSRVAEASLELARGRPRDALLLLREAQGRYVSDFFPDVRPLPAQIASVHIRMGNLDIAEAWARGSGVSHDVEPTFLREFELVVLVRLLIARGDLTSMSQARRLVERLVRSAARGGRVRTLVELHVLAAIIGLAQHEVPAALAKLRVALTLAEQEALRRPFVDEAHALAGLFAHLGRREAASAFVRSVASPGGPPPEAAASAHPDLLEPLSPRETQVLSLLRTDMSGPEIAVELALSLNTLRTHTRSIFEKLGVNSRRAAIRRAEELRLFTRDVRT